jgi:hypothetical protein
MNGRIRGSSTRNVTAFVMPLFAKDFAISDVISSAPVKNIEISYDLL